jgi:hypothetical protein
MAKDGKPGRPAMAFGMKEMKGEGLIVDFVTNFVQRNTQIINNR